MKPSEKKARLSMKSDLVYEQLEQMARDLGPEAQMPTLRTLREQMGVSLSTLNTALAVLETRNIIRRRQGSGIYVSPPTPRHIALVCDPTHLFLFSSSPFWTLLVEDAYKRAQDSDQTLSLHFAGSLSATPNQVSPEALLLPENLRRDIVANRVHGVVSLGLARPIAQWIEAQGVPVVSFAAPSRYVVASSMDALVQLGVSALARRGCRRIGLWIPVQPYSVLRPDHHVLETFINALAAHDVEYEPALVLQNGHLTERNPYHATSYSEQGNQAAHAFFGPQSSAQRRPDGILCSDDMLMQGALMALSRWNIGIGSELQIATHTNTGSPALMAWHDVVIRLDHDANEYAEALFGTMEELLNGTPLTWFKARPDAPFSDPSGEGPCREQIYFVRPRLLLPEANDAKDEKATDDATREKHRLSRARVVA